MHPIYAYGTEEQKQKYLPKLGKCTLISSEVYAFWNAVHQTVHTNDVNIFLIALHLQ